MDIDWSFISGHEGGQRLDGYVPKNSQGEVYKNSGVTIATGVDLGQRDMAELERLRVPADLREKLAPYLGLRRAEADLFATANPLAISQSEANELDRLVGGGILEPLERAYNRAVMGKRPPRKRFSELPRPVRTVIVSVAWHRGSGLARATPRFWSYVTEQDWWGAYDELMDFKDEHGPRRRTEARYLRRWLDTQPDRRRR